LIPFTYFQNLNNYKDIVPASALLIYASLPPTMDSGKTYWIFKTRRCVEA